MTLGRFEDAPDDALSPRQQATLARIRASGRKSVPRPFRIWLASPDIADAFDKLGWFLRRDSALTAAEVEIAVLLTARHWRCDYVIASHRRAAAREGLTDAEVEALLAGPTAPFADPRRQAIAEVTVAALAGGALAEPIHDRAVAALGHAALTELCALVGYYGATCMALNLYAVPPA